MRWFEIVATVVAGAVGAAVVTVLVGHSLLLVVPAAVAVGAIGLVAERGRTSR